MDERKGMTGHWKAVLEWDESDGKVNFKKDKGHPITTDQRQIVSYREF